MFYYLPKELNRTLIKKESTKKIEHINKTIQSVITSLKEEELENINTARTCYKEGNKHKEDSSTYDNEGKEKTLSMPEMKEKSRDGYVSMYECDKNFCQSIC